MIHVPSNGKAPDPDTLITRAVEESVSIPPSVARDGIVSQWSIGGVRGTYLPAWGTRAREYALHDLYNMDEQGLIQGALSGIAKAIASLPWEIKASEEDNPVFGQLAARQGWRLRRSNGVEYYQEAFRQACFGEGWGTFIEKSVMNFLRYDTGAYVEAIYAGGESFSAPHGPLVGLNVLDTLKCYPTGDPRYPAVYYDRWGGMHVMHHARVIRLVDMLDTDELRPGYGHSGLSRAIAIAMQETWIQRYITSRLDDQPPPGVTAISNLNQQTWAAILAKYEQQQRTDGKTTFGQRIFVFGMDMANKVGMESFEFSAPPEKFDYDIYTKINVDRLALALGVDRQELMQLQGGNMGSGSQSQILAQKSRGKLIGLLIQEFERRLNDLLPDEFTFEFKYRDSQEAMEEVQKDQLHSDVAATLTGVLSNEEKRTYLSNTSEAIRDAIANTPRANDVFNQVIVAEDNTAGANEVAPQPTQDANGQPAQPANDPNVNVNIDTEDQISAKAQKDYLTTQALFVQDVRDLLVSASTPNTYLDRRAFTTVMRSFLKNYGLQAYKDGLAQGQVYVDTLDPEDNLRYMGVLMDQNQYISGLADDVYKTKSVTPATAQGRAMMWGKSLQQFTDKGMGSAAANGMFEWRYGLAEHCKDCLRLNGQVHRYKTYEARGILPRSSKLFCKGYNCKCQLVRTSDKARGRF
jgi:hypothetical protein